VDSARAKLDASLDPELVSHLEHHVPWEAIDPAVEAAKNGRGATVAELLRRHRDGKLTDADLVRELKREAKREALTDKPTDPGGRGQWILDDSYVKDPSELAALRALEKVNPPTIEQLVDLVKLRTLVRGGAPGELIPGSPEHTLARWREYEAESARGENAGWKFKSWMAAHASRMSSSERGPMRELSYRRRFAALFDRVRSRMRLTPVGNEARQIDVAIPRGTYEEMVQIKSGEEGLGTQQKRKSAGQKRGATSLSNPEALEADREFVDAGERVTWVFEKMPTGPLIKAAHAKGIGTIIRVMDQAGADAMARRLRLAGMSEAQYRVATTPDASALGVVEIVIQPDLDAFEEYVVERIRLAPRASTSAP
jgi:hypothetical protein